MCMCTAKSSLFSVWINVQNGELKQSLRLWFCRLWRHVVLQDVTNISRKVPHPYSGFTFNPTDGDNTLLLNVGNHLKDHTASQPRRPQATSSPPWEPISGCSTILREVILSLLYVKWLTKLRFFSLEAEKQCSFVSRFFIYRLYMN
jgi:hypothetical protein